MLRFGPDQTKKRWSEKYTGEHFRHDLRLAEAQSNRTDQTAEQKDNSKLNKKLDRKMYVVHWTYLQRVDFTGIEANRTIEKGQTFKREPKGRLTLQGRNGKIIRCYNGSSNGFTANRGQLRV